MPKLDRGLPINILAAAQNLNDSVTGKCIHVFRPLAWAVWSKQISVSLSRHHRHLRRYIPKGEHVSRQWNVFTMKLR